MPFHFTSQIFKDIFRPLFGCNASLRAALALGGAFFIFSGTVALADGLSAVPQINAGANSVHVPQLGRAPQRVVRNAPRRIAQPARQSSAQTRVVRVSDSSIVDFGESTEALGFRLPSVRQGVRIIAR